jgi:hypothetical protein
MRHEIHFSFSLTKSLVWERERENYLTLSIFFIAHIYTCIYTILWNSIYLENKVIWWLDRELIKGCCSKISILQDIKKLSHDECFLVSTKSFIFERFEDPFVTAPTYVFKINEQGHNNSIEIGEFFFSSI